MPPPTNLTATSGEKSVTLNWTAPAGVSGATYDVYRGTTSGGESATPIATGVSATTYTDTALTDGTAYFYTVKTLAKRRHQHRVRRGRRHAQPHPSHEPGRERGQQRGHTDLDGHRGGSRRYL